MRMQSIVMATLVILLVAAAFGVAIFLPKETAPAPAPQTENTPTIPEPSTNVVPPPENTQNATTSLENMIVLDSPLPNTKITNPLTITGRARGTWYFEASFPVSLIDENGATLAALPAQAGSDWMTENFVPFSATLTWATTTARNGTLILKRDNPSGLPEHDAELRIPVTF